jgi:hypothetical protein
MTDGFGSVQVMTDLAPGGLKAYGSGSTTLITIIVISVTVVVSSFLQTA